MSYGDPLIKEIKKSVYHLTLNQPIADHHPHLAPLLEQLETFFRKGLRRSSSLFEKELKDYWSCFEAFSQHLSQTNQRCPVMMEEDFKSVKKSKKVLVEQGRGRCFLRHAIQHKFLTGLVTLLSTNKHFLHAWYYGDTGLLYDSIQTEILLSALKQLNELVFDLNLKNQTFLDQTLVMPVLKQVTLVPCKRLGVEVLHAKSYCIVCGIKAGSVIEENGDVEVGDVLDEIFQIPIRNSRIGKVSSLLKKMNEKPIELAILKSKLPDGTDFRPIKLLMTTHPPPSNILTHKPSTKPPPHALLPQQCDDETPVHNNEDRAIYYTEYLGCVFVGQVGSVARVEESIGVMSEYLEKCKDSKNINSCNNNKLTNNNDNSNNNDNNNDNNNSNNNDNSNNNKKSDKNSKEADNNNETNNNNSYVQFITKDNLVYKILPKMQQTRLNLGETDVNVYEGDDVLLKASYTEISACGRLDDNCLTFTFIIGETTCTIAKQFLAHIFKARCPNDAKNILCTVAQGFDRTHWFV